MDGPTWVYASIAGVVTLHLFVLVYLRARRRDSATGASDTTPSRDAGGNVDDGVNATDGDTVRCRQCGAENRRRFRFCRNCVAELPGGSLAEGAAGAARTGVL